MIRSQRRDLGRIKAGKCLKHGFELVPSSFFDGGSCSLGCVELNLHRVHYLQKSKEGWRRN